jgi:S-adenosylmethionine hydrolase
VVVVDPGVGSSRHPIAVCSMEHCFVAPDNGVLSLILQSDPSAVIYRITNDSLFNEFISYTFHGRDIFAPVAANLARGTPIESVGPRVRSYVLKPFPNPRLEGDKLLGTVLRIDKFGNLVTNFRREHLDSDSSIRVAGISINRFCDTFSDAAPGELCVFEGSTGFIEVALNQGSASEKLKVGRGAEIELESNFANQ